MKTAEKLGRFGHHPDPAIDFCVEVEEIEAMHCNVKIGFAPEERNERDRRILRAMGFVVGGDANAVHAKHRLREIEREAGIRY